MKDLKDEQIIEIKEKFSKISTKEDLVEVINLILGFINLSPIKKSSLSFYANPEYSHEKRYKSFSIKKKSGGERIINSPDKDLKDILKAINILLNIHIQPHNKATGFVEGKSVVDNAKFHINKNYVFNIDLKDFFHSFDRYQVQGIFMRKPFNLNKDKQNLAFVLASLCTHAITIGNEEKMVLPQGAPTSPTLTNILCKDMDYKLDKLAKANSASFSRYADDITLSSNKSVFNKPDFREGLENIIHQYKLEINPKKVRLQKRTSRQEVTGVSVNEKLNTSRKYIKQVRMWLYLIEQYGVEKASLFFRKDYIKEKGHIKCHQNPMLSVIGGKLLYLKMVKGEEDSTYLKLAQRFDKVCGFSVDAVLDVWKEKDAKEAGKLFEETKNKIWQPSINSSIKNYK